MKDLTILIPSFDTRALLASCLSSVEAAISETPELDVEVLVVDNGSRDGSVAAIRDRFPAVRWVALSRNLGFARAINRGLALCRGRIVLLLNSDVEIEYSLLRGGMALLDERSEIGVLGPCLRHPNGRPQSSVHPLPSLATELLPDFLLRLVRPQGFASAAGKDVCEVEAVRGAAFFLRASLIEKLGHLDERYFFFLEETDYCRRVREAGHTVVFAPMLSATHRQGGSSKRRLPLATRIEFHRSLYRYLAARHGTATARLARGSRIFRGSVLLVALGLSSPFLPSSRRKLPERFGLWWWHLRGCPDRPTLQEAFEADRRRGLPRRDAGGQGWGQAG